MGKWIDRIAISSLTAAALYLLFLYAFGSIAVAAGMSFFSIALLFHSRRRCDRKNRMSRLQAQTILETWAYAEDSEAEQQIQKLLGRSDKITYLSKHPTATVSLGDVFGAWKKHRGDETLMLAFPCRAESRARTFAATLREPAVEIIDSEKLISLLRSSDFPAPRIPRGRVILRRFKDSLSSLPGKRPWHRNLLTGLALMFLYLITGSAAYLALSVAALFISGVSLRIAKRGHP